jgi:hypothetical protein
MYLRARQVAFDSRRGLEISLKTEAQMKRYSPVYTCCGAVVSVCRYW